MTFTIIFQILIHVVHNKIVDLSILKNNLKKSVRSVGIGKGFKFYQDDDSKYKARIVQEFLLYNCSKMLETFSQYPELNPIKNL